MVVECVYAVSLTTDIQSPAGDRYSDSLTHTTNGRCEKQQFHIDWRGSSSYREALLPFSRISMRIAMCWRDSRHLHRSDSFESRVEADRQLALLVKDTRARMPSDLAIICDSDGSCIEVFG